MVSVREAAVVICLTCGALLCLQFAGAAPRTLAPEWGNLDGMWQFKTDPGEVGEQEGWQRTDFDDSGWRELKAPGLWEPQGITDARPGQPPKPKGTMPWSDYDGVAWYRLHVVVPEAWAGQPLLLELGSVDDQDRTFFNGQLVGATEGVERSVGVWRSYKVPPDLVRAGQENVVAVRVKDGGGPGGIPGPMLSLLPESTAERGGGFTRDDQPFEERFANPPADCRILKIVHGWSGQPEGQDGTIRTLLAQGFGGVVCNVAWDKGYLEDPERWDLFVRAVNKAKQAGMAMWLYDERGYPSGVAGGITLRDHPEWEARGLLVADCESDGGEVSLNAPPGELVQAVAYPVADGILNLDAPRDLRADVREGKLTTTLPAGSWHVFLMTQGPLYENTHAALSLAYKDHYINLLMPEPTKRFLEVTHQAYARHLGQDLGKYFAATFTDEPSLMSCFMRPMEYRPLPWAPALPAEFARRRGYALEPVLAALIRDAGPRGLRARHDFWQTVGELVSENFFGQIQQWCREHNIPSGGHLLIEESLVQHVCYYGNFFACIRRLDAPSIDCLTSIPSQVPWHIARMIDSVAQLNGNALTMCETSDHSQRYRPQGDNRPVIVVTEEQIRGTCNRLMVNGINTITSYYSFSGLDAAALRRLNTYIGRCSTATRGGTQVADIALLYPIESVWPRFTPSRRGPTDSAAARMVETAWRGASEDLWNAARDFTYVDSKALCEARVEGDALVNGKLRWRVVILPRTDTLPLPAWENLARFWRAGGVVICLDALPVNDGRDFPAAQMQALTRELFGADALPVEPVLRTNTAGGVAAFLPEGMRLLLPQVLDAVLKRDFDPGRRTPLHATHRRTEGHDVYFIINDSDSPWEGEVTVCGEGAGEVWDPATGERQAAGAAATVSLKLQPYGGVILRYPSARTPERTQPVSLQGAQLPVRDLPEAKVSVSKGEFVDGGTTEVTLPEGKAWLSSGTLTKGNVDTFLFTAFTYPQPVDLSDVAGLYLRVSVPEGQKTPTNLLVFIEDADGTRYLGDTGRAMSLAGMRPSFVGINQFRPFSAAPGKVPGLDLTRITSISVGWGGYFGTEGEKVSYTVLPPQVFELR